MKSSFLLLSSLFFESFFTLSATAQVTPDGTTSTTVKTTETGVQIDEGDRAGGNLFHSFGEFSIPTGSEAYFNNANDISNIFTRVTGSNISNIDGLIRANGTANLFLINPNGILFGENASLQLGGSFFGSTADSIVFPDGEFSATDLNNPPLITINAPIGLGFRDNPEDIINRSTANDVGLQVDTGETISFSGGEVSFDGGMATAPRGKVEVLGNKVSLVNNASINVSSATGGGVVLIGGEYQGKETLFNASRTYIDNSVKINADALTNGNGGRVIVWANEIAGFYGDISARGGSISGNGGFVEVSGKEHLIFRGNVDTSAVNGFTGTLLLDPDNIIIANGLGDESADGTDSLRGNNSDEAGSILSTPLSEINDTAPTTIFETELEGLSGDTNVILQARNNIILEDLADDELTFAPGKGVIAFTADADRDGVGDFTMQDNTVVFDNELFEVVDDADTIKTNGRNIAISGANLTIGNIDSSLVPPDNAGSSPETAQVVSNSSGVVLESISGTFSDGESADVYQIFVTGDGTFSASTVEGTNGNTSLFLFDAAGLGIYGNDDTTKCGFCGQSELPAGDASTPALPGIYYLAISRFAVPVSSEGKIFPDPFESNDIDLTAILTPTGVGGASPLKGFEGKSFGSESYTIALTGVEGTANTFNESNKIVNGGNIKLDATNGNITTANLISSNIIGEAEIISLNATKDIVIGSSESFYSIRNSSIGKGGNISLNSSEGNIILTNVDIDSLSNNGGNLSIIAGGKAVFSNFSLDTSGDNNSSDFKSGNIQIKASAVEINDSFIFINSFSQGNRGNIDINSGSVKIANSFLSTGTFGSGQGNAGNISITANNNGQLNLDDSFLTSDTSREGNAGNIELNAGSIRIANDSSLTTSTPGEGNAGNIELNAGSVRIANNSFLTTSTVGEGNAGNIELNAGSVRIANDSFLTTETSGEGNAGNISITANNNGQLNLDDSFLISSTFGQGNAGNIELNAGSVRIANDSFLSTGSFVQGNAGNISVKTTSEDIQLNNSEISASASDRGTGGNINLTTPQSIYLSNDSKISTSASGFANGGDINIDASFVVGFLNQNNDILTTAEKGSGGRIDITVESILGIEERPLNSLTNDISASSEFGLNGTVSIKALETNSFREVAELADNVVTSDMINASNVCEISETGEASGLVVKGKGGVTPEPTEPISAEVLIVDEEATSNFFPNNNSQLNPEEIPSHIQPVAYKNNGEPIYLARGVIVQEDGTLILTAYETENSQSRSASKSHGCN